MSVEMFQPRQWVPHHYQLRGTDWLITHPEGALFLAPGLGKTTIVLNAFIKLRALGYDYKMLVLAPLRVAQSTWMQEYKKWAQFQHLRVGLAHGPDKPEIFSGKNYDIVVINYDALPWASQQLTQQNPFQILCCDELTRLKHTNTKRFKAFKPCLPKFQFRFGLTGTPAANGLLDLFGQLFVLDLGYRLGRYITHYRASYFHQKPRDEFNWYITPDKAEQIHRKVADLAMYIKPEEVLQLPDLLHTELSVTLPKPVMEQYKSMEALAVLQLGDAMLTAANAGGVLTKLRQIAGGGIYIGFEHKYEVLHTAKLDALDDLIEELAGEPLLLVYNYTLEMHEIAKRYPNAPVIKGGMGDISDIIDAWNTGMVPVLIVQISVAAYGLNLQAGGSKLCMYSQTYNLEEYQQVIKRLHRQGQLDTVNVYHLLAEKTIDGAIRKVLAEKDITQEALFSSLRNNLLQIS